MVDVQLAEAQTQRDDLLLTEEIDRCLDLVLSHADVSGEARNKLRHILKHYAKNPHPFRACVRDNMKRFGPGRTERICATVKDMIRGKHTWRSGRSGAVAAADVVIDEEIEQILLSIPGETLDRIVLEAADATGR